MPGMRSASAASSWFEGADVCSPVVSSPHSHMSTSVTMKYSWTAEDLRRPHLFALFRIARWRIGPRQTFAHSAPPYS
jgi:hypothetical protein